MAFWPAASGEDSAYNNQIPESPHLLKRNRLEECCTLPKNSLRLCSCLLLSAWRIRYVTAPSSVGMNVAHRTSIHVASTSKNPHLKPPTPPSPNNSFEDHKRSHRFGSTLSTLRATSVLIVVICLED
ncbi:hypothetical protein Pst134EA_007248 [Puccinia striiformis f. sp. tritici]|nr:hypothetical protein Pst134EA_007248 [Puccinia striiformis f. sp. tritici]KAH9460200.1 hypothetical protein Pst134EB_008387 [Puccinia striiformis f. sp. tritici]KAH9469978.1 hypothetical protein Pst134EA_007248 [Puccinia striiformis f. sp. tritici]